MQATGLRRRGKLRRDDRAERHIGLLPEPVVHDAAVASDQDAGRRALHPLSPHGDRDRDAVGGLVDADREGQPVFVDEGLQ